MSLHKFAEQVAANGRGDDSLLVHMTPDEVRNLQKFAEANGTTLTINPDTGLPEAGLLSDLFKAVAPIALGAFLGPAGMGLTFGGLSSAMSAGIATGGITALATGSLSRGLMAGLGAYGGAGLGESFMTAGGGMSAANAATTAQQQLSGANLALGEAMPAQAAEQFTKDAVSRMTPSGAVSAGFNKAIASPTAALDFAKSNMGNLAYAASPIAAGLMVPTTTKLPDPKSTGNIRQMAYNINPDTGKPDPLYGMREMAPVKASEFGNKTFQGQRDLFYQQNPTPYELGVGSLNQPPQQPARMNTGGIVALANGGVPGYAGGGPLVNDQIIFDYFKGLDQAQLKSGALDAQIAADMQKYDVGAADISRATGTQALQGDYEKRFVNAIATPTTDASEFLAATKDVGLTGQNLNTALQNSGLSASAQYALTHNLNDAAGTYDASGKPIDFYNKIGYTAGAAPGDQGGLEGLYANINYSAKGLQDQINAGNLTVQQAQNLALAEMDRVGVNQKDIKNATGKAFGDLFTPKTVTPLTPITPLPIPFISVVPGGTQMPGATTYANGAYGNYGSGPATGVDYRGNTVSIATPGDIITNPDGTRTVVPNIPGRPYGGFTGMEGVKSAYTAGGGSLGYTAKAPKTIDEFNKLYNKQTGDSLAAYDYLMGKGGGKYPVKSGAAQIAVPYNEYVLGKKTSTKPITKTTTVTGTPGQPQTYFDEAAYLAANPDVAAELKTGKSVSGQPVQFTSGYEHYLKYGQAGGRAFTGDYSGYKTALALASASQQGGPGGTSGPSGTTGIGNNSANSISGLAQDANPNTPVVSMDTLSPDAAAAAAASAADGAAAAAASASGNAPGGDGSPGSGAKRGGLMHYAMGGGLGSLGSYSDGGRLLKGPGDGVSDSIPATIGEKQQPARLADGEFVIPARIVSELGNGSTDAGAKKLYAMMDRVQRARGKTTGKNKVAANSRSDKYLPA
jgi:hypothetical protein